MPFANITILFQNKSVLVLLPLFLKKQSIIFLSIFSVIKSLIIKMTFLYIFTREYIFLYLIVFIIFTITSLFFYTTKILDIIIFLEIFSIFKFAESQIFFLFNLTIILPNQSSA